MSCFLWHIITSWELCRRWLGKSYVRINHFTTFYFHFYFAVNAVRSCRIDDDITARLCNNIDTHLCERERNIWWRSPWCGELLKHSSHSNNNHSLATRWVCQLSHLIQFSCLICCSTTGTFYLFSWLMMAFFGLSSAFDGTVTVLFIFKFSD